MASNACIVLVVKLMAWQPMHTGESLFLVMAAPCCGGSYNGHQDGIIYRHQKTNRKSKVANLSAPTGGQGPLKPIGSFLSSGSSAKA
jgi:hypothetical protein